jgi:hypothetical protein
VPTDDRRAEGGDVRLTEMAFRTLGKAPDLHEIEAVARDLREHGEPDDLALFAPIDGSEYGPTSGPLGDISERCGSSRFVALDLLVEFCSRGATRRVMERGGALRDGPTRVSDWRDA